MNKTVLTAGIAALGASAVLAGGGTFAAWSDFDVVEDNTSGASRLTLDVSNPNGSTEGFELVGLAPGEFQDFELFLANTNEDAVSDAELFMTLDDLVGREDGCTSRSEAAIGDDCEDLGSAGEFISQAQLQVITGVPVVDRNGNASCNPNLSGFAPSGVHSWGSNGKDVEFLDAAAGQRVALTGDRFGATAGDPRAAAEPGEELCVRLRVSMPADADNASQGDSASYALLFEAEQVVGSGGGNGYQNDLG